VYGVHFTTGFCTIQRQRRVALSSDIPDPKLRLEALHAAAQVNVPIEIIDVADDYLDVVLNPKHGYGSYMNPCQDCRAFMLRQAKKYMEKIGANFIITGEVVGQRPNSQKRHLLFQSEKESGLRGMIVRPLSAQLLPPTIAEEKGWIDRKALYSIAGRGRKIQIELAHQFGIEEYAQPAGGCCMLVTEAFSQRLRDFLAHNQPEALDQETIAFLSIGRHLRLPNGLKVIVGRHEGENNFLDRARRPDQWRFEAETSSSPVALALGPMSDETSLQIASIVAGYSKDRDKPTIAITIDKGGTVDLVDASPMEKERLIKMNVNVGKSVKKNK
jgi:tRNA U34 2-thiouridine synthase MnmA/TrmU